MRVVIRWTPSPEAKSDRSPKVNRKVLATRQERIRDLMLLALGTPAGRDLPDHADLCAQVEREGHPERLLGRFPIVPREEYFRNRERYLNPESPETGFRHFDYPVNPPPRTAILMEGFVETQKVMCFPDGWAPDLDKFRAECLAGPVTMLRRMAVCVLNSGARFPSLRRPLVAFTGLPFGDAGLLTDRDRDQFWTAFRVRVEEHFLGHRHEVLARECFANSGLHLDPIQTVVEVPNPDTSELVITSLANSVFPVVRLASGFRGTLTDQPCPCGFRGQRLLNLEQLAQKPRPRIRVAMGAAAGAGFGESRAEADAPLDPED